MFPLLGAVAWGAFAEGVTLAVSVYQTYGLGTNCGLIIQEK